MAHCLYCFIHYLIKSGFLIPFQSLDFISGLLTQFMCPLGRSFIICPGNKLLLEENYCSLIIQGLYSQAQHRMIHRTTHPTLPTTVRRRRRGWCNNSIYTAGHGTCTAPKLSPGEQIHTIQYDYLEISRDPTPISLWFYYSVIVFSSFLLFNYHPNIMYPCMLLSACAFF